MQVKHDLPCPTAVVDLKLEIFGFVAQLLAHLLDSIDQGSVHFRRRRHEIVMMLSRADQQMCRGFGVDILEDNYFVVLVEQVSIRFTLSDFAENTIFHSASKLPDWGVRGKERVVTGRSGGQCHIFCSI